MSNCSYFCQPAADAPDTRPSSEPPQVSSSGVLPSGIHRPIVCLFGAMLLGLVSSPDAHAVSMKRFDLNDDLQLESIERRGWSDRWDMVLPGGDGDKVVVYSRHRQVLKVVDVSGDRSRVVSTSRTFGGAEADYVDAVRGDFVEGDMAFYDRVRGMLDFYEIDDGGRVSFTSSQEVGNNVDAMAAGNWESRDGMDLALYDKFAGNLRLMQLQLRLPHSAPSYYELEEIASAPFDMNVEQLVPGNFDGDSFTDVLAFNQDAGTGKFFEFERGGGMNIIGERDDLPKSEGVVIVPGNFSASDEDRPKTDLLFYSRDCAMDASQTPGIYHNTYSDVFYWDDDYAAFDTSACQTESLDPGCDENPEVQECVCAADDFCCDNSWDDLCVDQVVDLGCYAEETCDGVGQLLTDVVEPSYTPWGDMSSWWGFGAEAGDISEDYEWSQTFRWNRQWTHIVASNTGRGESSSELLFYSNNKAVDLTMVLLDSEGDGFVGRDEDAIRRAMRESVHQLNRSFLPAGIELDWDGTFTKLENTMLDQYPVGSASVEEQEEGDYWADLMGNSECRSCMQEVSPLCASGDKDSCESVATGVCEESCPVYDEDDPDGVMLDSLVVYVRSGGLSGCSSARKRFVMFGATDDGQIHQGNNLGSDGHYLDRFGNPLEDLVPGATAAGKLDYDQRANFKTNSLKLLVHEVGHYFGLAHTHNSFLKDHLADSDRVEEILEAGGTDGLRDYGGRSGKGYIGWNNLSPNTWFPVRDTAFSPAQSGMESRADHLTADGRVTCADEPLEYSAGGMSFRLNPERTQPMTYGAYCDGIQRFSREQIQGIRYSLHTAYWHDDDHLGGKSFLVD